MLIEKHYTAETVVLGTVPAGELIYYPVHNRYYLVTDKRDSEAKRSVLLVNVEEGSLIWVRETYAVQWLHNVALQILE